MCLQWAEVKGSLVDPIYENIKPVSMDIVDAALTDSFYESEAKEHEVVSQYSFV